MRRYLRRIARARMEADGVRRINHSMIGMKGQKLPSYFATHWRDYAPKQSKVKHVSVTK